RFVLDVRHEQIHRRPRRLLFAVGVIDQELFEMTADVVQPSIGGGGGEIEHAWDFTGKGNGERGTWKPEALARDNDAIRAARCGARMDACPSLTLRVSIKAVS